MQEYEGVLGEVFERHADDVPGASESCRRVSHAPFGLETPSPQPGVREGKALAAVVVLAVIDPDRASLLEDSAVLRHTVRHAREQLR